jgi:hypothetical protein
MFSLPRCPLTTTTLVIPCRARLRATSLQTALKAAADTCSVPGKSRWCPDRPNGSGGSTPGSGSTEAATRSTTASPVR